MLVDAGGGRANPGRRALLPLLQARRRTRLRLVVLSHPHPDHLSRAFPRFLITFRSMKFGITGKQKRKLRTGQRRVYYAHYASVEPLSAGHPKSATPRLSEEHVSKFYGPVPPLIRDLISMTTALCFVFNIMSEAFCLQAISKRLPKMLLYRLIMIFMQTYSKFLTTDHEHHLLSHFLSESHRKSLHLAAGAKTDMVTRIPKSFIAMLRSASCFYEPIWEEVLSWTLMATRSK